MMDSASFVGDTEGEARLLLLIDAFTGPNRTLQGRVKLAKLDFLLRYPQFARRALAERNRAVGDEPEVDEDNIEGRMVRYRYGPWDPAYTHCSAASSDGASSKRFPRGATPGCAQPTVDAPLRPR